jgi:hypothetical protein
MITTMKPHIDASLTFTVPLALEAHFLAQEFRALASNPQKAKQIYLNTLAVYAVNFYLQCQGLETEWEKSDSANPVMQTLLNVADLQVKGLGKFECIAVLPDSETCYIPPEIWEDRIGYIAVHLNESLREATLLGFVEQVTTSELPIKSFKPLEELPNIYTIHQQKSVKKPVNLGQWFNDIFDASWQTIEEIEAILNPPGLSFRGLLPTISLKPQNTNLKIQRAKLLHLDQVEKQVILCVSLGFTASSEIEILVKVYSAHERISLPEKLQLLLLDQSGMPVMQAEARSTKSMSLKFSGEAGESFAIKVALGNISITENFFI